MRLSEHLLLNTFRTMDLLALRLSEMNVPEVDELDVSDLLDMQLHDASVSEIQSAELAPSCDVSQGGALVPCEPPVASIVKPKRKLFSSYDVNGKRHRTTKPNAKPMSKREAIGTARAGKAKKLLKRTEDVALQAHDLAIACAATSRVRVKRCLFNKKKRCSTLALALIGSLKAKVLEGDRSFAITADQISEVAFDNMGTNKSRAAGHHMSARSERRCGEAHSMAALLSQELLLAAKEKQLRANPPDWSMCSPLWDETTERVKVFFQRTRRMITATMHMFVYTVTFMWGWAATGLMDTFRVVVPPLPVSGTSADKLWDAMRLHPWTAPIHRFKCVLAEITSSLPMQFAANDQASGNIKLVAYETLIRSVRTD